MNVLIIFLYFIFAVGGSTLIKLGGLETVKSIAHISLFNISISVYTLFGFILYGVSFLLYTVLLNKFELSFISPITVSGVYILLMLTAFIIFKEPVTIYKIFGSVLILGGIILMIKK